MPQSMSFPWEGGLGLQALGAQEKDLNAYNTALAVPYSICIIRNLTELCS